MKTKGKSVWSRIWSQYSYVFVFLVIFLVYALTSNGLTWNGIMNIFRHSAVVGVIGLGMGLICLTGKSICRWVLCLQW